MTSKSNRLTWEHGHLGTCHDCLICRLTKNAARRIYSKVDPHYETRPAFKWHLDTVTWSARSSQGNKYMTVMRCEASDKFKIFCHYLKSDISQMIYDWILEVRREPAFNDCPYKVISIICLDNAGEWDLNCVKWKTMMKELGTECIFAKNRLQEQNERSGSSRLWSNH